MTSTKTTTRTSVRHRRAGWALHWKITLATVTLTVLGIGGATAFGVSNQIEHDRRDLEQIAGEAAAKHAARFANILEQGCGAAHALAGALEVSLRLPSAEGFATHERLAETIIAVTRNYGSTFAGVYFTALPGVVPPPDGRLDYTAPDMARYYTPAGHFAPYFVGDADGVRYRAPGAQDDPENEPYFVRVRDTGRAYLHRLFMMYENGKPDWIGTSISYPVRTADGVFVGVAGVEMRLDHEAHAIVTEPLYFGAGASLLLSPGGAFLETPPAPISAGAYLPPAESIPDSGSGYRMDVFPRFNATLNPELAQAQRRRESYVGLRPILENGETALVVGAPVILNHLDGTWMFISVIPTSEILAAATENVHSALAFAILAVFLAVGLGVVFGRSFSRAIEARQRWYERILDLLPTPLVITGAQDSRVQFINQAVEERFGLRDRRAMIGRGYRERDSHWFGAFSGIAPDTAPDAREVEFAWDERAYRVRFSPLADDEGRPFARLEVALDVTGEKSLAAMVDRLIDASGELNAAATDVAGVSVDMHEDSMRQAEALEQIATTTEHFAKQTGVHTETALREKELSRTMRAEAENLAGTTIEARQAMEEAVEQSARMVGIVKMIEDVAFQTNLLALNASVEAARAGRAGKGFAVVADEVRNLATRSAKSAVETSNILETVRQRVTKAGEWIEKTGAMLQGLLEHTTTLTEYSTRVAATAEDQSNSVHDINGGLLQLRELAQKTAAIAEQAKTAADALSGRAERLRGLMDLRSGE